MEIIPSVITLTQESFSSGIIIHGLLWENDALQVSMVESRTEMVIEEAHYQSLLAGQTEIMIQNTDTIYISNRFMCIIIAKTIKHILHLFFLNKYY